MLLIFVAFSCQEEASEVLEPVENAEISEVSLTNQSLNEIDDLFLNEQLPKTEKHTKELIVANYDFLYKEHDLSLMILNTDYIFVDKAAENTSYTIIITIPHKGNSELLSQYAYLTMNFRSGINTENQLLLGVQKD